MWQNPVIAGLTGVGAAGAAAPATLLGEVGQLSALLKVTLTGCLTFGRYLSLGQLSLFLHDRLTMK